VADFTSALYLGLVHGHADLRPWPRLTAGAPAALVPPAGSRSVTRHLALLVGSQAATLGVSTLHLFWDLFGQHRRAPVRILADEALYPVGRWGIERAVAAGIPAAPFAHHDPGSLLRQLETGPCRRAPLVVTDGFCPDCGRVAPLDRPPPGVDPAGLFRRLREAGVRTVLRQPRCRPGPRITFLLHSHHAPEEIDRAVETVARTVRLLGRTRHERPELRSLR
jgi:hypothetical protein